METLHKEKQQQRNHRYTKKLHLTETALDSDDEDSLPPEVKPQIRSRQQAKPQIPETKGKTSCSKHELVTIGCQTVTLMTEVRDPDIEPDIPDLILQRNVTKKVITDSFGSY